MQGKVVCIALGLAMYIGQLSLLAGIILARCCTTNYIGFQRPTYRLRA